MNPSQPQTLQIAVLLCYFRGVMTLFGLEFQFIAFPLSKYTGGGASNPLLQIAMIGALVGGGWLMANERRTGWKLAVAAAALPLLGRLMLAFGVSFGVPISGSISPFEYDVLGLMFEVALFLLLVHPQSRDYQRIWFK